MKGLNNRQQLFCQEYLKDFNATQAAIRAGYSEKSSYSLGHALLKNHEIRKVIEGLSRENFKAVGLTSQRVVAELATIAFSANIKSTDRIKALEALMKYELAKGEGDKHDFASSAQRVLEALANMRKK